MPPCSPARLRSSSTRRARTNGAAGATPTAVNPLASPTARTCDPRFSMSRAGTDPSCQHPTGTPRRGYRPRRAVVVLRAAVLRAGARLAVVFRAGARLAVVLRAGARLAVVLRAAVVFLAVVFFAAVLRGVTLRAVALRAGARLAVVLRAAVVFLA